MNYIAQNANELIGVEATTFCVQVPETNVDMYFSADVETDGPIPGPYSILSFAIVYAGTFDGKTFRRPQDYRKVFYRELRPISEAFKQMHSR